MPRKPQRPKTRRLGSQLDPEMVSWIRWHGTLGGQRKISEEAARAYWRTHREDILKLLIEEAREKGWPAVRPEFFWQDLKCGDYRRKRIGTDHYYGCMQKDRRTIPIIHEARYETNFAFLKRLGLLEPWELEAGESKKR